MNCRHKWKFLRVDNSVSVVHGGPIQYPVYKCTCCSVRGKVYDDSTYDMFYEWEQLNLNFFA